MINLLKKKFMVILILVVIIFNFTTSISIVLATDDAGTDAGTDAGADTGEPAPEQIFNEEEAKEAEEGIWGEEGESLNGGVLYKSFVKFTTGIGDIFIKFMQKSFLGEEFEEIQYAQNYGILYSPAAIFSGKIPAFDIDFFGKDQKEIYVNRGEVAGMSTTQEIGSDSNHIDEYYQTGKLSNEFKGKKYEEFKTRIKNNYGYSEDKEELVEMINSGYNTSEDFIIEIGLGLTGDRSLSKWENEGKTYYKLVVHKSVGSQLTTYDSLIRIYDESSIGKVYTEKNSSEKLNKVSVASILQEPVSKWYAATRTIALVGLLSGIVYIGIRIVISSTGKEQAKYKQWIMNWVAAICLLFILHYLMAGIIKITQEISEIFIAEIAGDENTIAADEFMTGIRTTLGEEPSKYSNFPELVIYIALVIYTLIFTFHYLKRVVYMAFLTMVAPLIALTYPIDKIKDSKSQAFDMWLKEYIYNALLQVMHLILYYVFIHSATELVDQNPIYAIITIGFFVPAEKFIKKMFGFNNQESMGEFEAAAGGALTMNAINEVSKFANSKGSAPEGASDKSGGSQQQQGGTNINFSNSGGAWNNGMPPAGGGTGGGSDSESDDNSGVPQTGTPPTGTPPTADATAQDDSVTPNDFDTSTGPFWMNPKRPSLHMNF